MQQNATFQNLAAILADLEQLESSHAAFFVLWGPKAKAFMQSNAFSIKRLAEFRNNLVEEFAKKDDNGKAIKVTMPDNTEQLVFDNDEIRAQFTNKWNEFMEKNVLINM